jgi:DNA polymerase elongation subunit (family B)
MDKKQVINEIKYFLEGKNDELKYIVNVETDPNENLASCVIHEPNKDYRIEKIPYTPFLYIKNLKKIGYNLYHGDKDLVKRKMGQYGITLEKMETGGHSRLENGYPYKVTSTKSYNSILHFFRDAGLDPFETVKNDAGQIQRDDKGRALMKYRDLFFMPKMNEQFFISTGARLFKGIEEYKDLHRLTFDIETTGLRFEHSRIFAIGVRDNKGFEVVIEVNEKDDDDEERRIIQDFFNVINYLQPAVIAGYNSEEFDYNFIMGRAEILNMELKNLPTSLSKNHHVRKAKATVKFGNSTEEYRATYSWGYTIIDILHAAKRTQAVNTDMKNVRLKYVCQFEGIAKPNRMYIDGDKIGQFWDEDKVFIINPDNNNYKEIPDDYQSCGSDLYRVQLAKESGKYPDDQLNKLKKQILTNCPDFVDWAKGAAKEIAPEVSSMVGGFKFMKGKDILRRYLLDDLWETEQVDNLYNQSSFLLAKIVPTTYGRIATMGNAAVWNLLMTTWSYENNLAIPHSDEIEQFSGGLTRCFKKGLTKRLVKIDYASLYPMIQLTEDVFPFFDITGVIKKMLTYMTTTRNIYKKIAAGKSLNEEEVALMKDTDHDTYDKYINDAFTDQERKFYKVKQLPIKILNNSLFGALGSGFAFNWSDNICAARITCTGRLHLRHAIHWFKQYGCEPLLAVTDGVNFGIPDTTTIRVTEDGVLHGQARDTIEKMWRFNGEEGVGALIEKFNKEEMKPPYMSVDNDGEFVSCLNLSRINYALAVDEKDRKTGKIKRKIKFTGNTIKSKTMPEYIEDFIDSGMKLILDGKGKEFVDYYYDYAEKIFYKRIPLKKIASKSKVKMTIKDYLNRGTDKNGREKASQAHMELLIQERNKQAMKVFKDKFDEFKDKSNNSPDDYSMDYIMKMVETYLPPEPPLDSMIYYVNNGTRKSHNDVKKKTISDGSGGKKIVKEINATLINQNDLEHNPEITGEYNVEKYLSNFNERVEKILDGFDEEIIDKILVKVKRTKNQIELVKNQFSSDELVLRNHDLDNFDEAMFLEDKEILFWNRTGYDPHLIWDEFSIHEGELTPEIYQWKLDYVSEEMEKKGKPRVKSVNDNLEKGDFVLIKNNDKYSLGYHNGTYVQIIKDSLDLPQSPYEQELDPFAEKEEEENTVLTQELKHNIEESQNRVKFFEKFKAKFSMPKEWSEEDLYAQISDAKELFEHFIQEQQIQENPMLEYDDIENV